MDQSCWIFQMAHLSTWYRCISIDIPGYGRSPKGAAGLSMDDMAEASACWEAVDDALPGETAILVGCSTGSAISPFMYHQRPDRTAAMILTGTGYSPGKEFAQRRIDAYTANGVDYRWRYTFEDLSPAFRATPLAHFFANLFAERWRYTQPVRGCRDYHSPVQSTANARTRGPSLRHRLPGHDPDRK